ncbi:MAG: SPOR domain-containing protein [Bacteroidota bacterium]
MKYISELLYDHDCVIIPGFGGFVSSYESAYIDREKNLFHPPCKKILFNSRLKSNDGILANFIASSENISYEAAMNVIRRFASSCNKEMDAEKKVRFRGIGLLFKDENGSIQFEQDTEINYLPQAFGLTSFHFPVIHRLNEIPHYRRTPKDNESLPQSRRWLKGLKWAAVLVPLAALGIWGFLNKDMIKQQYKEYAKYLAPITNEAKPESLTLEEAEQIAEERGKKATPFETNHSSFLPSSSESLSQLDNTKNIVSEQTKSSTEDFSEENTEEEAPKKENQYEPQGYFIITGSFKNSKNAQQHIRKLEQFGFSPLVVDENSQGYHRVAALKENSRSRAIEKLNFIRREDYPDAWLLAK